MLRSLCKQYTTLSDRDIDTLTALERNMQYIADLTAADVFIDCIHKEGGRCVVVAEANPRESRSIYGRSVVGEWAERENEPAVFTAIETGLPARDIRAVTQEKKSVRQVVVPIQNDTGAVIGVLIQEKDVSDHVIRHKKFEELAKTTAQQQELLNMIGGEAMLSSPALEGDRFLMKEIHHRVKNNLQMVASILNIQARRSPHPEVRAAFRENVSRILSFAAIHDILTVEEADEKLVLTGVLRKVCSNIRLCADTGDKRLSIDINGEELAVDADFATSIALVVNELVMNAVKHAFQGRESGRILVELKTGMQYATIAVYDNGTGFREQREDSFGLELVRTTVKDKLGGSLRISSDETGTTAQFDFRL